MKNFDDWNKIKKDIEKSKIDKVFHTQEIWWCSIGINIGFEEDGKNNNLILTYWYFIINNI